jgi:flagellar biosynthesis regulator FlaF
MEKEAQSLGLSPSEQVRLAALLHSAKEALTEAEKMIPQDESDGQQETANKLRLWERKLLDLSLRNNLLNMKLGKNAIHSSQFIVHSSQFIVKC